MGSEIAGVLFDLGGTLVDYDGPGGGLDVLSSAYRAVYEVSVRYGCRGTLSSFQEQFQLLDDSLWEEAKAGRLALTLEAELAELFERTEVSADPALVTAAVEAYCQCWQAVCVVYPDSLSTLRELKAEGLRIGLVSNTALPGRAHVADLDRFGLLPYFDDVVFSSEVGFWKPQPEVYNLALSRLGLRAENAAFVGDRLIDDVIGAKRVGLRGILVARCGENFAGPMLQDEVAGGYLETDDTEAPDATMRSLAELPGVLDRLTGGMS